MIIIPDHTCPTWNQVYSHGHWSQRKRLADAVHKLVWAYAPRLAEPLSQPVHVTVTASRKRRIDADNVPVKLYVDGLCKAGVLADDDARYVTGVSAQCIKGNPNVVIELTEADNE